MASKSVSIPSVSGKTADAFNHDDGVSFESQSLQYQGKLQTHQLCCTRYQPLVSIPSVSGKTADELDLGACKRLIRLNPFSIRENCRQKSLKVIGSTPRLNPFSIRENCRQKIEESLRHGGMSQSLQYQGKLQTSRL